MKKNKISAIFLTLALFCGVMLIVSCASFPGRSSKEYAFAQKLSKLLEAGNFEAALAAFDELEEPESSNPDLLKLKLAILVSSGDLKAAVALADSLTEQYGEDADILYARAVIALVENRTIDRSRYLRKMLEIEPTNMDALLALGSDSLGKKAYGDAIKWYSQALVANRGNTEAHRGLAHSYYLQGKTQEARQAVDRALAIHPDNAALLAESALIHVEEKNLPAALNDLRRAVALDPNEASYWSTYGVFLVRASKLSDARDALSKAIRLDPDNIFPYLYRCGVNDTLGFTEEALSDYRFVYENYPQYYYASEGLGALLWLRGDFEGAKNAFAQAFKYAETNLSYALMFTLCSYKLGEKNEAKRFIGRFMNTIEDRSSAEYFVCRLFFDLSGDGDVLRRVSKLGNVALKSQLMFYVAAYYELFKTEALAAKFYQEAASAGVPTFFEHRLAVAAAERTAAHAEVSESSESEQ